MNYKISGVFVQKRFQDSGVGDAPDFYVYEFSDLKDDHNVIYGQKWFKETKLLKAVKFIVGHVYTFTLSSPPSRDWIKLPHPTEISWEEEKVTIKGGNSIVRTNKNGQEVVLSGGTKRSKDEPNNHDKHAKNKLYKGLLTEQLLLKLNARGRFFKVSSHVPEDRRLLGSGGYQIGFAADGNYILIKKETQAEIDKALTYIKQNYVKKDIEKYFKINTEIAPQKYRGK